MERGGHVKEVEAAASRFDGVAFGWGIGAAQHFQQVARLRARTLRRRFACGLRWRPAARVGKRYRAGRPANPQAGRLRHTYSMPQRPWDFQTELSRTLGSSYAVLGHWVGGIATRVPGGHYAAAVRTGQLAAPDTNMKIIDVPQSERLGTFVSYKTRYGQFRRPYIIPSDPKTPAQLRPRRNMGRAAACWRTP
jgi:hypothetical protein